MECLDTEVCEPIENLLLVGPYPPPFGGVSSHLYDLNESFKDKHFASHILQFDSSSEDLIHSGAKIFKRETMPLLRHFWLVGRSPGSFFMALGLFFLHAYKSPRLYLSSFIRSLHVVEMIDTFKISRTVVYTTKMGGLIPFVKLLRPSHDIFYCIYAGPYKNPEFYRKHRDLFRRAVEQSKKVFSSSCYCAESFGSFTKTADPSVIYVGVDLERFHGMDAPRAREKLKLSERPTVLFLGRMEPEMGAENALEIGKIVLSKGVDVNFIIGGASGILTETLEKSSAAFDGRLMVKADISKEDLPLYYGAATVAIAPTIGLHACMGVSIKEAMASGRPVIASDSGGIPEAIRDGIDGYVLPLENGEINNEAYAAKILEVLADHQKSAVLGENARERCEKIFSVDAVAAKYMRLFDKD